MDMFLKIIPFIVAIISIFILILVIHKMLERVEDLLLEIEKCKRRIAYFQNVFKDYEAGMDYVSDRVGYIEEQIQQYKELIDDASDTDI